MTDPSPSPRRAFITGITGQDGSYLAEQLLARGVEVHGLVRRAATTNTANIDHLLANPALAFRTWEGDLLDAGRIHRLIDRIRPHEIYHLGAQSRVDLSFETPGHTLETNLRGTLAVLDAIRSVDPSIRMYQASSSEMFGWSAGPLQDERTPFHPRSPYAVSKVAAHHLCVQHRESYGLFICCGILFNHESPRRGRQFVTRKVAQGVARIHLGLQEELSLGGLEARRDWGFAPEYTDAMWRMLQQEAPGDYVIATGESHSVAELVQLAFALVGRDWHAHVREDPELLRPAEVPHLAGDARKAARTLGWRPTTSLTGLVRAMLTAELAWLEPGFKLDDQDIH